jgi:flagellin-like protein
VVIPLTKKKGLSEVVSTLILLVVAVLLAGVVAYYATNVTMTRSQTEDIQFTASHVWVNSSGAVAAFKLQNLGGRDILIDKFTVRGVASAWTDVFIYRVPSGTAVTDDMIPANYTALANGVVIDGRTYNTSATDVPLISGVGVYEQRSVHNRDQRRVGHHAVVGWLTALPTKEQYLEDDDVS